MWCISVLALLFVVSECTSSFEDWKKETQKHDILANNEKKAKLAVSDMHRAGDVYYDENDTSGKLQCYDRITEYAAPFLKEPISQEPPLYAKITPNVGSSKTVDVIGPDELLVGRVDFWPVDLQRQRSICVSLSKGSQSPTCVTLQADYLGWLRRTDPLDP